MPEYLSPGVYVEEIDAGPKPIEGVSTSTAGAVGVTARGPDTGKPILITSFADYVRVFGGPVLTDEATRSRWSDDPEKGEFWTFPLAIKGFFENGGQRIYVRRVVAKGADAAAARFDKGVIARVAADGEGSTVKLSTLIGISKDTKYTAVVQGKELEVTVTAYDNAAGTVTVAPPLPKVTAGKDYVRVTKVGSADQVRVAAKSRGAWGNDLSVRAFPMEAASYTLLADSTLEGNDAFATEILEDVPDPAATFAVRSDAANDATKKLAVGDRVLVGGETFPVTEVKTVSDKVMVTVNAPARRWKKGTSVIRVRFAAKPAAAAPVGPTPPVTPPVGPTPPVTPPVGPTPPVGSTPPVSPAPVSPAPATAGPQRNKLQIWGASSLYPNALLEIEDTVKSKRSYVAVSGEVAGTTVTLARDVDATLWEGQRVRLIEAHFQVRYRPAEGPEIVEDIANVRLMEAAPGDPQHVSRRLPAVSSLIDVVTPPEIAIGDLESFPLALGADGTAWKALADGDDDLGSLDVDAFVGVDGGPGKRTGIQALEDIDEVSIVIAPSMWSSLVQNALIAQCELLKYRFAILDPRPVSPTAVDPIGDIRAFREGFDTKYAALYFPRIEVRDPFASRTVGLGPSGHMAGLYARIDVERGVHKAPANEVLRGLDTANGFHGLEDEITRREQDVLNPKGINAIRFFPDRGTRVWGARTLSSDGAWKYINVRRTFIMVERSIDVGTQWVVFEPNDEKTWARVRQTITNFLTTVWRSGALFGSKAEQAFFVRCDRTTMTQDDIDNGRLICVIGIAPVKPAEFVIFRIQQKLIDDKQ